MIASQAIVRSLQEFADGSIWLECVLPRLNNHQAAH